ncbi:Hypothetical protein LUCI_1539 [Lucifera butyrica]|uniref:Thioesterase domain-containing protein n=1 Tax=Lucifera butyrica TaxID=1351585 RepID=A0A498R586_9FIRM|nr:PaaI family thioesterase [Lucifera butyrica]VBB06309.1 Hypothetical protein LUCI_1539 [Lucifera butyrica]
MTTQNSRLTKHLGEIYDRNPFVKLLDISVVKFQEGMAELSMPVISGKHTNLHGFAHGGSLFSLADTAMGAACGSLGKRVVTLTMSMNFVKSAGPGEVARSIGRVIHNGRTTMVVEAEIFDANEKLLAKATGTFFVVGYFEP